MPNYVPFQWQDGVTPINAATLDHEESGIAADDVTNLSSQAHAFLFWTPSTAYAVGQQVINPAGFVVAALIAHTSGLSYAPGNWSVPVVSGVFWTPSTTYAVGQEVISPYNAVVTCVTAHTSTSTYAPSYWSTTKTINVKDYGAKGDGATDDTAALQAAFAAIPSLGGCIEFPPGNYVISNVLAITNGSTTVKGAGKNATKIISTSTTADVFTVGANGVFTVIKDMSISRSVTPTAGYGVHFLGANSGTFSSLSDLYIRGHSRGLYLTSSTYGHITRVIVDSCVSDGVFITNDTQGACQWQITDCLSQGNGGDGWRVFSQSGLGAAQLILGTWTNVASFANTGYGFSFEGNSACPIQDIRIMNCFVGQDGSSEVNMDTYGQSHLISGLFTELTGSQGTGLGLGTAASGYGHGVVISANNADVTINGGTMMSNSQSGIYSQGADVTITGMAFRYNGQNSDTAISSNCGIYNAGGNLTVTGCSFKGNPYGIYTVTDTILAVGNTIRPSAERGTAQAIVYASGTTTASVIANNRLISV